MARPRSIDLTKSTPKAVAASSAAIAGRARMWLPTRCSLARNSAALPPRRTLHPAAATASIPAAVLWPSGIPRRRGRGGASGLARDTLRAPGERQHDKERGEPSPRSQRRPATHSITSSVRARIVCGIVRPSVFAVLRLTTSSNRLGFWTGKSTGFTPLRIFPAYSPVWRQIAVLLGP